jgi:hypothetical protein
MPDDPEAPETEPEAPPETPPETPKPGRVKTTDIMAAIDSLPARIAAEIGKAGHGGDEPKGDDEPEGGAPEVTFEPDPPAPDPSGKPADGSQEPPQASTQPAPQERRRGFPRRSGGKS